ncbi:MAG TPA: tRNA uridine-5-carboxymethylaminomethyl(34) synthesis GTPase MnmE, partial [bacterium]|nr:tRNA uridine-5-carboxymethylaminomethyl(34) synthesis GTPase MnmE [bacterium]
MNASDSDTIAAIASPSGRGGVGIIRVSGSKVRTIAAGVLGEVPPTRRAVLRKFSSGTDEILDEGLALLFAAPKSFTGEDVLELHGHGGPVVLDRVLARVLELGARPAHPGEFSRRAFLNEKLDLTQAEAIADLIDSSSVESARAAIRSLQGEFSTLVHSLTEAITETRMHVEAAIDFPEEEIDFLADELLRSRIERSLQLSAHIASRARQGALLREGMTLVIAGKPNAGKSSLLNRLAGYEAAIVSDIPGTTRDVLRERIHIDGMPIHIADTAGLREQADVIEAEGIRRAHQEMNRADRILYLVDAAIEDEATLLEQLGKLPGSIPITVV